MNEGGESDLRKQLRKPDNDKFNPFAYVQHPSLYPNEDHERIPDLRVYNLFKKTTKLDLIGMRIILIIGNIGLNFVSLAQ